MGSSPSSLSLMRVLDTELARPLQPVVALDARFCSARPTTLHFQRATYTQSFRVRDITANNALRFRTTRRASWRTQRTQLELLDARKRCIAHLEPSAPDALKPAYAVRRGDNRRHRVRSRLTSSTQPPLPSPPLFQIRARTKLAATDVRVDFTDAATNERCTIGLVGSWLHRTGILWLRHGRAGTCEPIAKLFPPAHGQPRRDEFCLSVSANVDAALLVLVCLALHDRERLSSAASRLEQ